MFLASNFERMPSAALRDFSDFDRSDAKIAIFQRTVNKLLKFCCKFCEKLREEMYALFSVQLAVQLAAQLAQLSLQHSSVRQPVSSSSP